ncbi:MAG: FAD-dependent oxidoreductase, partial [Actinomycetota bacterium]|nr:FAD-dependent oxidoreductase [Actinomycetota bacterium]
MTRVDVLVVGAGPAGATTAYHLARRGVDVLMVDRAAFPREKVCGDGLTPRGVRALQDMGIDATADGFVRIDGLRSHGDSVVIELPWPDIDSLPDFGVVRTRHDLDHLLVRHGVRAGVALWERAEALGPLMYGGWVRGATVRRDGRTEE